ncbi:MAG: TRAM domain-containing protein [Nanoarchaeota archaeon]|nr:TRAM domain-containing protein [Nanoarchaeota archaeon]
MYGTRDDKLSPVKEGDEVDVKIEAIGEKGDGIAKIDGFVLIIPNTKTNDQVKVRITKVLKKVGFAEVIGKSAAKLAEKKKEIPIEDVEEEMPDVEDFSEDFGEE